LTTDDVKHFEYRGSGWPGHVLIVTNDGREIKLDHTACWADYKRSGFRMAAKCKNCRDFISDIADICVGDAWIERIKDKKGTCIVLAMNPEADEYIKSCHSGGYISLEQMEDLEFATYYKTLLDYKISRVQV